MHIFDNLLYELYPTSGILLLTFNRSSKMNAHTLTERGEALRQAQADPAVRGLILAGSGEKAFVAGADIAEFMTLLPAEAQRFAEHSQKTVLLLERSTKPTIAAVNGFALGGCCEVAMACHIRVASDNTCFGQPEVNLGIIPGYGGTQRLVQLVGKGKGKALELMMSADQMKADEARQLGLVNHVVPAKLLSFCCQLLGRILGKAPVAVAKVVRNVEAYFAASQAGYATEAQFFADCCQTHDFHEGAAAFVEKRPAVFTGR